MKVDQRERVSKIFCEVMEKFAFMFGELTPKEDLLQTPSTYVRASMTFDGELAGRMTLIVPEALCAVIAANVLGIEPDDALVAARALDALKEILNITCGHVVTDLVGEQPVFELSIPVVSKLDEGEWPSSLENPDSLVFLFDDNPVLLQFTVSNNEC